MFLMVCHFNEHISNDEIEKKIKEKIELIFEIFIFPDSMQRENYQNDIRFEEFF